MPWCTSCRQEYRAGIERCADCGEPLVADLAAHDASQREAAASRRLEVVAPAGTLQALAASLAQRGVPCAPSPKGGALLVPLEAAELLEASLARVAEYERVGDVLHVYGARQDLDAEVTPDPSWLERDDGELAAAKGAAIPGLLSCLASPKAALRVRAAQRLERLAAAGAVELADVLVFAAQERLKRPLFAWAELLAERPPEGLAAKLVAAASRAEARVASQLLHVVGRLHDRSVARALLPLLDHGDPLVREEADEVLISLAGTDVGYDAEAEPAVRARAVQLWRERIEREAR